MKRFIFILSLVVGFFTIGCMNTYAANATYPAFSFSENNTVVTEFLGKPYYANISNAEYAAYVWDEDLTDGTVFITGSLGLRYYKNGGYDHNCKRYLYDPDSSQWVYDKPTTGGAYSDIGSIYYSPVDIYDNYVNGNVVFQTAPPVQAAAGALAGLIQTETLLSLLAFLKPLVPLLLISVIGFIAFRKAYHWALTQLSGG